MWTGLEEFHAITQHIVLVDYFTHDLCYVWPCRLAKEMRMRTDVKRLPTSVPVNNAPLVRRITGAVAALRRAVAMGGKAGQRTLTK